MNARQEGFTIAEVVISMVLMAIILTTLAGLTYATARQAVRTNDMASQQAAMLEVVNRYSSMPYAQVTALQGATVCDSTGSANNWFRRCARITSATRGMQVQIVTTPRQRNVSATTAELMRVAPAPSNPLCIGC